MNFFALGLIIPLAACSFSWNGDDAGSGAAAAESGTTRSFQVAGFDGIDLRGSDDIDVRVGTGFSIRAEGPSDELDRLKIDRDGETLNVGRKTGSRFGWNKRGKVKVYVTLPRLIEATVSGSGTIAVDRVEGTKFDGVIPGSGTLTIAAIKVDDAAFSITGSGNVRAAGAAKALEIDIAGSGEVDAPKLQARSAKIEISGSGTVRTIVDGPAAVEVSGSGDVDLGPNARCTISKTGSGTIRCGK